MKNRQLPGRLNSDTKLTPRKFSLRFTRLLVAVTAIAAVLLSSCSLPPERPLTRRDLSRTNAYRLYTIEESPEAVLNALNREGEVVLEGAYRKRPVLIKFLATPEGIEVTHYNR